MFLSNGDFRKVADDKCRQIRPVLPSLKYNNALLYELALRYDCLNLPKLNSVTKKLHLLISTTHVGHVPICAPSNKVTGIVHPSTAERILDKPLGSQIRAV